MCCRIFLATNIFLELGKIEIAFTESKILLPKLMISIRKYFATFE